MMNTLSYNLDAEKGVIGAILASPDSIYEVQGLKPEHFYDNRNRTVFQAISDMSSRFKRIDLITVTEHLRSTGKLEDADGAWYIAEVTANVFSASHIKAHAEIIRELAMRRDLRALGESLVKKAEEYTSASVSLAEEAEKALYDITKGSMGGAVKTVADIMVESLAGIDAAKLNDGKTGVTSGFNAIDSVTGGWQPSDLVILAARPSQGKTALALNYALNAAREGFPVLFFSLEMSARQLGDRLISSLAKVPNDSIRSGRISELDMQKVFRTAEQLSALPISIDDSSMLSITEFRAKARKQFMEKGVKLIIVDYLQLMTGTRGKSDTRESEVAAISRALKAMAKELNVPVIALSQLSRATESRGGSKRPFLSDLRESGAIEQDADVVTFIHRPEYYGIMEDEAGNSTAGKAEIIFAKHRNGKVGIENLRFDSQFTLFNDVSEGYFDDAKLLQKPANDDIVPF